MHLLGNSCLHAILIIRVSGGSYSFIVLDGLLLSLYRVQLSQFGQSFYPVASSHFYFQSKQAFSKVRP